MKHRLVPILMAAALAGPAGLVAAAPHGHAHEHGVVRVQVGVDGPRLELALQAPLDSLLGFERAPRTDAERRAAEQALATLRQPQSWLQPDAAAGCTLETSNVDPGVLAPGAPAPRDGHAEVEASYAWRCAQPQALRGLEIGLFDAFRRLQRIEVEVADANGQGRSTLKRPARVVKLQR
ncbi:DUF2796 domain-containing protein [Azohydromonas aeria]|uniref:DUF2796 domain-containing protein n=1 Tax=Azohydromonas aeria TaxID=2590212 RepID=UPI0018DF9704|nr:DUF2796 domain-containing protein [Azohydromonas aeria]